MTLVRDVESGWSDVGLLVQCYLQDENFGEIVLKNLTYNDNLKPFAEINLTHIPSEYGDIHISIKYKIQNTHLSYAYAGGIRILDVNGNTIGECYEDIRRDTITERWCDFKVESGTKYYLVAIRESNFISLKSIKGLGYYALTKYGLREYLGVNLRIYDDYYDSVNSSVDNDIICNYYALGIPAVTGNYTLPLSISSSHVNEDIQSEFLFIVDEETGYNFSTDIDITGVMVLDLNDFYGLTNKFNKAVVKFYLGGVEKAVIDLLTHDAGSESNEFSISAGRYNDAKVVLIANVKEITEFTKYKAQVSFRWMFDSPYEGGCV